jgi:hypothetical protein
VKYYKDEEVYTKKGLKLKDDQRHKDAVERNAAAFYGMLGKKR